MSNRHAKRACETCRRRRVKCDKSLPTCQRCELLGRACDGYKVVQRFWDESENIRRKYDKNGPSPTHTQPSASGSLITSNATFIERQSHVDNTPNTPVTSALITTPVYPPDVSSNRDSANISNSPQGRASSSAAWLIEPDTDFSQIRSDSPESLNQYPSCEDYFDLDIDTYYANGNNACGFIPGAPVILNNDGVGNGETDDGSSWLGSEQINIRDTSQAAQHSPPDRANECMVLLQHFVDAVAPSMDLFDSEAYFGRLLPYKVRRSSMLRLAVAAVAAKQITRLTDEGQVHDARLPTMLLELPNAENMDWNYKAADYYDEGISYLRIYLHRSSSGPSPTTDDQFDARQRQHSTSSSSDDEELLSAIAVLSLYESMNENAKEWKQHVAGFYSFLQNILLPRASSLSPSPEKYLASVNGFSASFWNIVGMDYLAAYQQQSRTQVNPDDFALWQAMGLRSSPANTVTSSLDIANEMFKGGKEDEACRVLLWILAKIMNFLTDNNSPLAQNGRLDKWRELRELLHIWHNNLPGLFRPYASVPYRIAYDENNNSKPRFTQHLFTVPMCGVAILLYHFAQVLLLINWPAESTLQVGERLRTFAQIAQESQNHGREICNTALGIRNCRAGQEQVVEPLYVAGMCLENVEDRAVVVALLKDVEKNVGCPVAERVRELLLSWERGDKTSVFL